MSADSYHHMFEKSMAEMGSLFDFEDWVNTLNQHGEALILDAKECLNVPRGVSQGKYADSKPYIENIHQVKFQNGSSKKFWKGNMENESYQQSEFLQRKYMKMIGKAVNWSSFEKKYSNNHQRGISQSKNESITTKLCPMMPERAKLFWEALPCNNCDSDQDDE